MCCKQQLVSDVPAVNLLHHHAIKYEQQCNKDVVPPRAKVHESSHRPDVNICTQRVTDRGLSDEGVLLGSESITNYNSSRFLYWFWYSGVWQGLSFKPLKVSLLSLLYLLKGETLTLCHLCGYVMTTKCDTTRCGWSTVCSKFHHQSHWTGISKSSDHN